MKNCDWQDTEYMAGGQVCTRLWPANADSAPVVTRNDIKAGIGKDAPCYENLQVFNEHPHCIYCGKVIIGVVGRTTAPIQGTFCECRTGEDESVVNMSWCGSTPPPSITRVGDW